MYTNLGVSNFVNLKNAYYSKPTSGLKQLGFGSSNQDKTEGITSEQTAALSAQCLNTNKMFTRITEKDINLAICLGGFRQIGENTRNMSDTRLVGYSAYGQNWSDFNKPLVIYNRNGDERINGDSTLILFPIRPGTKDYRRNDNMAFMINGKIPQEKINALLLYLVDKNILNATPIYGKSYYLNTLNDPGDVMKYNAEKIKKIIADFLEQEESKQVCEINSSEKINTESRGYDLKESEINIAYTNWQQDKRNIRTIKNYTEQYLQNDKKITVIYDKFNDNNEEKDMTIMLVPLKGNGCIALSIDRKISEHDFTNLLNYLNKMHKSNTDDEDFKAVVAEYFNTL